MRMKRGAEGDDPRARSPSAGGRDDPYRLRPVVGGAPACRPRRNARCAEEAGFEFALISDHYHPWTEGARIYTLPEELPPIVVAADKPGAVALAAAAGDGLCATAPESELVQRFAREGGDGKPRYGQATVCYADSEEEARRIALEWWPNGAIEGDLNQELPLPSHFEQAASLVTEEDVAASVVCGPDPDAHRELIRHLRRRGLRHVYVHQVGPDQESFLRFYEREILPAYC